MRNQQKTGANTQIVISPQMFEAAIFDLDGVVTQTASAHAASWKAMFDEFLRQYGAESNQSFEPFDIERDYHLYVDGKPRYEGVKGFLDSRGLELPLGKPNDSPGVWTIYGMGNLKNRLFQEHIRQQGVDLYESSVELIRSLRQKGMKTAMVSSSKNAVEVLQSVNLLRLFDTQVDGVDSERLQLKGKPNPDIFLQAAKQLEVEPEKAIVFEDAIAGVEAARLGGFGFIIGVDRANQPQALIDHGADIAIKDLQEVIVADGKASE